jgi:serine/threonine protein kinase
VNLLQSVSSTCNKIVTFTGVVLQPRILLMEFYEKGVLQKALTDELENRLDKTTPGFQSHFPFKLRMKYLLDLTVAVGHLHKYNLVHRDLAMRNLLLSDDRKSVVLTDFGLARQVTTELKKRRSINETVPKTSPPETWVNSKYRDFSVQYDMWGLALTI